MSDYPKPSLSGEAVVLAGEGLDTNVLVIQRKNDPFKGYWAFPGGLVEPFELPLTTALRELKEETGLSLTPTKAVALSLRSKEGRDPRGWTLSQPYLFYLENPLPVLTKSDSMVAEWISLARLKRLAFDHGAILCEALGRFWEGMPEFHSRLKNIKPFSARNLVSQSITFFGGSFNPWHHGHSACLSLCPQPVVVVPDMNPFKKGNGDVCYWQQYQHILQIVGDRAEGVFPGFLGLESANPTVAWLPATGCQNKSLLIGDDNLVGLPTWIEANTLVKALDCLYIVPRNANMSEQKTAMAWIQRRNPNCRIVFLGDHPFRDISSTAIRQGRHLNP